MTKIDWTKPQRQAPIGLVIFSIETIRKLVRIFWPIILGLFFGKGKSTDSDSLRDDIYLYGSIILVLFVLVNSLLSYWFFRFRIVDNELVIKKGYLKKINLSIPLERIQTVNIKQNIIQKILNLVAVDIDTAGANETEVKLIAVRRFVAEDLREKVKQREKQFKKELVKDISNEEVEEEASQTILALSLRDVVKVGLTENHLRSFSIILASVFWLYSQIEEFYKVDTDKFLNTSTDAIGAFDFTNSFWFFVILFLFLVSVFISFVISFIRFYELKLKKQSNSFKLSFGLISTKEITVPMSKIQLISWHRNPLRQMLLFETLKIKQASSDDKVKKKQAIEIPACGLKHQKEIKNAIFGENEPVFSKTIKSHWLYYLRAFIFVSVLFVLPTIFYWWDDKEYQLSLIIYELFWASFYTLAYFRRGFRISETQLELTKGHVSKTIYQLQNYKIQSVKFRQNIFIKRRGLADVVVYTAAGENLTIPYIPEQYAKDLCNFLLYKIESTSKAWM